MNCRSARPGEGESLACPPHVVQWLHDEVVQRLSSVAAALDSEGTLTQADRVRCRTELEVALRALGLLLCDALAEDSLGRCFRTVGDAVRAVATTARDGKVELRIHGDAEISGPASEFVADFVAEALRNADKHARPRATVLTVSVNEHAIRVDAFNDGVTCTAAGAGTRIGLRLLAARARDHSAFVSAQPLAPDGWSTTLLLLRGSGGSSRSAERANRTTR